MTFNVNQFKSEVTNRGVLRTHSFLFMVPIPSGVPGFGGKIKEIALKTESSQIPGASFMKSDNIKHHGYGPLYNKPYNVIQTDITATHIVDRNGSTLDVFTSWMNFIIPFNRTNGIMDNTKYLANYHDEFAVDINVDVYNEYGQVAGKYIIFEAYPTAIDPITVGWAQNDDYMKLNVTYSFTDWQMFKVSTVEPPPNLPFGDINEGGAGQNV